MRQNQIRTFFKGLLEAYPTYEVEFKFPLIFRVFSPIFMF